jgi:Carboxypeptidase regulatory-like domain
MPDGKGASGVKILLFVSSASGTRTEYAASTDGDGDYSISGVTPGTGVLRAYPQVAGAYAPPPKKMMVGKDKRYENEDFTLDPGEIIEGKVVDSNGNPISKVSLRARVLNDDIRSVSESDGTFVIEGVPPNGSITSLTAAHPEYQVETRTSISVLDGFQLITLHRTNGIILEVKWKLDGTPVSLYAYRLWKDHFTGLEVLGDHQAQRVDSEDGTTRLDRVDSGKWKVEVTILNPEDGSATDIRNAEYFTLEEGVEEMVVSVLVDGGATLKGTVQTSEGDPVAGATIEFVPPSKGFGRFPPQVGPFKFPTSSSDSSGYFEMEGMPPGHYTLQASKGFLITTTAVDTIIPYNGKPEPVNIILSSGGRIYGKFFGEDGQGLEDAVLNLNVQRPNADGWILQTTKSDQDGNYKFNRLPAGAHPLSCSYNYISHGNLVVNLEENENKEQNFYLDAKITLSGNVQVNGKVPLELGITHILLNSSDGVGSPWILLDGSTGHYETEISPGMWKVLAHGPQFQSFGEGDLFEIPSSPSQQTRNFDLDYVPVSVVLVFPEDDNQFVQGNLVVSTQNRLRRYAFHRRKMTTPSCSLSNVQNGFYQATFTTRDNMWHGGTEWTQVGVGLENILVLDMKKTLDGVKIGSWNSGEVSLKDWTPFTYEVTHLLESEGTVEIVLNYESGRHAVETGKVSLLENGAPISVDDHVGWSGADRWNHIYNLNLNNWNERAVYTIETNLRGDGGSDSNGSVFLSLN